MTKTELSDGLRLVVKGPNRHTIESEMLWDAVGRLEVIAQGAPPIYRVDEILMATRLLQQLINIAQKHHEAQKKTRLEVA